MKTNTYNGKPIIKEIAITIDPDDPRKCGSDCPQKGSNEIMNRSYCRLFNNFLTNPLQVYVNIRLKMCIDTFGDGDDVK